jgi:hypothetical protein
MYVEPNFITSAAEVVRVQESVKKEWLLKQPKQQNKTLYIKSPRLWGFFFEVVASLMLNLIFRLFLVT